ncbi:MAG: YwbE family protein [Eubacteriales bacterium]
MDGNHRDHIRKGLPVLVVQKQDQSSGNLTQGIVEKILTNSSFHRHGIKVRLISGEVGRVKKILS